MRIYFSMGITIFIASLLGGILPVISSAIAALICVLIYKRHPIMVGAITAELSILGNILIGSVFFNVLSEIQTDADTRMGAVGFIIISFVLGALIGFIYKILINKNKPTGSSEIQACVLPSNKSTQRQNINLQDGGYKEALIAFVITFLLTVLFVNTFGIIAGGIYLGYAKKGKQTNLVYYILCVVLFLTLDLVKGVTTYEDNGKQIFVVFFSSFLMAAIPLGISYLISKVLRR